MAGTEVQSHPILEGSQAVERLAEEEQGGKAAGNTTKDTEAILWLHEGPKQGAPLKTMPSKLKGSFFYYSSSMSFNLVVPYPFRSYGSSSLAS